MPAWQECTIRSAAAAILALSTVACALGTRYVAFAVVAAFASGDIHIEAFRLFAAGTAVALWMATTPLLIALAAGRWP